MKNPEGLALAKKLIAKSDVVGGEFQRTGDGELGAGLSAHEGNSPGHHHGEPAGLRSDRTAARLCQLRTDSHVLFRHDLSLARPADRAAGCRQPDCLSRLHRALLRRGGDPRRSAPSSPHRRRAVYRHFAGRNRRVDDRSGVIGTSHQRTRARTAGQFQRHGGAPWLLPLQRRRSLVRHRHRRPGRMDTVL